MKTTSFVVRGWVGSALGLCLLACGGGSGVDRNKPLSSTTAQERVAICEAEVDSVFSTFSQAEACKITALSSARFSDTGDVARDCRDAYDECMTGDYETEQSQTKATCEKSYGDGFVGPFACSAATVGDMEDCTQDRIGAAAAALPSISECELLDEEDLDAFQDTLDVASCRQVATVCDEEDEQAGGDAF